MANKKINKYDDDDDDNDGCRMRDLPRHRRSISQLIYNLGKINTHFILA